MITFERVETKEQIAKTVRLAREIWTEHYAPIIGQAQVEYMLATFQSETAVQRQIAEGQEYFLVLNDGRHAGYLAAVPNPAEGSLLLSKIYVKYAERGLGVGGAMLRFVEKGCIERGIRTIWLTVNKNNADSIAWYLRMGFMNVGPVQKDIGGGFVMDDYRMEKAINL